LSVRIYLYIIPFQTISIRQISNEIGNKLAIMIFNVSSQMWTLVTVINITVTTVWITDVLTKMLFEFHFFIYGYRYL